MEFYRKYPGKPRLGIHSPVKDTNARSSIEKVGKENLAVKKKRSKDIEPEVKQKEEMVMTDKPKEPVKKKKKSVESDESDFVMEVDAEESEEDGEVEAGMQFEDGDEAEDAKVISDEDDDLESADEALGESHIQTLVFPADGAAYVAAEKPVKKNPGWGSKVKAVKKAPVNLYFHSMGKVKLYADAL